MPLFASEPGIIVVNVLITYMIVGCFFVRDCSVYRSCL